MKHEGYQLPENIRGLWNLRSRAALLGMVLLCLSSTVIGQAARDPGKYFFDETFGNLSEELERARQEGKQGLLLFFETDDCPFCHRMRHTVLNQPEVQDWYRERFLKFSVDANGDTEMTDFQGQTVTAKDFAFKVNRVRATPVIAFFDLQGKRVYRYIGATNTPEEFLWLGEFVVDGHYRNTNFTRFKREKRRDQVAR